MYSVKKIIKNVVFLCSILFIGLLAACSFNNRINAKSEFVTLFELEEYKESITLKELYNNYEGAPYEGVALYEVSITAEEAKRLFSEWDSMPFNDETADMGYYIKVDI